MIILGLGLPLLGGCETGSTLFGGGSAPEASQAGAAAVTAPAAQPAPASNARIAIAPVMGAPENVSTELANKLAEAVEKQKITTVKGKDANAEHVVRGYIVAAKENNGTKLSYIWDITDKSGSKRSHRIQGEDLVKGQPGQDPWAAVDAKIMQGIADKTATKIAQWLPAQQPAVAQSAAPQKAVAAAGTPPAQPAAASPQTTASIDRSADATTYVAAVQGAPGDGSTALAEALRRELQRNSVTTVEAAGAATYKVQGRVAMGQPADGKQTIQIEWTVIDPAGKKVGTVSQKNAVQQGSLDGAWGQTADNAASAAAQGIIKLLQKPN